MSLDARVAQSSERHLVCLHFVKLYMPAGLAKCDLASVRPTKEKLEAARTILDSADEKELRSKMGVDVELAEGEPLQRRELITRRRSPTLAGTLSCGAVEEQAGHRKPPRSLEKLIEGKATYQDRVCMAA